MKNIRLTIVIVFVVLLLSFLTYGQTWDEEGRVSAGSILQEKFQLEESLGFNQEGALDAETLQAFPASVSLTDEGLTGGLTVALVRYGEETFFPLFVASLPEFEPPYGFALMNNDGEVVSVGPAEIEGTKEGPEAPVIELVEEKEGTYKISLKFTEATIGVELQKTIS